MRLNVVPACLFAIALAFATPAFARTAPATGTSSSSSESGMNSATTSGHQAKQFKTETQAKSACGKQQVVWANTSTHVLHTSGSKYFGKTKNGAYMCENVAMQSGYHMVKNSK